MFKTSAGDLMIRENLSDHSQGNHGFMMVYIMFCPSADQLYGCFFFSGSSLSTRLPASRHVHDGPRDGCRDLVAMRVAANPALGYQLNSGDNMEVS